MALNSQMSRNLHWAGKVPWLALSCTLCFFVALGFIYRAVVPETNILYARIAFVFLVLTVLLGLGQKFWNARMDGNILKRQDDNRLHGRDRAFAIMLTFAYLYAAGWILNVFSSQPTSRNAHIAGIVATVVTILAIWIARD